MNNKSNEYFNKAYYWYKKSLNEAIEGKDYDKEEVTDSKGNIKHYNFHLKGSVSKEFTENLTKLADAKDKIKELSAIVKEADGKLMDMIEKHGLNDIDNLYKKYIKTKTIMVTVGALIKEDVEQFDVEGFDKEILKLLNMTNDELDVLKRQFIKMVPNTRKPSVGGLKRIKAKENRMFDYIKNAYRQFRNRLNNLINKWDQDIDYIEEHYLTGHGDRDVYTDSLDDGRR